MITPPWNRSSAHLRPNSCTARSGTTMPKSSWPSSITSKRFIIEGDSIALWNISHRLTLKLMRKTKSDMVTCRSQGWDVDCRFWPGAEDKALRGRNLSAVFRTLYRQEGEPSQRLSSCAAQPWRVENQCDKSNRSNRQRWSTEQTTTVKFFSLSNKNPLSTKQLNRVSVFSGQAHVALCNQAALEGAMMLDRMEDEDARRQSR